MFIYFINPVIIYTSREIFHEMCKRFVCFITKCMFTFSDLVHCALAVVRRSQKFSPHHRLLPGGAGRPKFNQLEMVTTFTYKPSLMRIYARNFELSW